MTFHSLAEFLDPEDPSRTLEGYPAPRRALVLAETP
jgi:tRNA (mo5U34)-methyltransferase